MKCLTCDVLKIKMLKKGVVLPTATKWLLIGGGLIVGDFTLKYKTQVVVMWCKMNETKLNCIPLQNNNT